MINKHRLLNGDSNKDPNINALKRRGVKNHGFTLDLPNTQYDDVDTWKLQPKG